MNFRWRRECTLIILVPCITIQFWSLKDQRSTPAPHSKYMDIEDIRAICNSFPHVTQDVKWGNDLVFSIGSKMFCVAGLNQQPASASFKVTDEEFPEISGRLHFKPAPYVARYKWVLMEDITKMKKKDWEKYLRQSYELVRDKLAAKVKKQLEK